MTAGMVAALSMVYGCQTTQALFSRGSAQTSEQVGNIYVSAYPAVPRPAIADKLAPANNLTIDRARGMAATTTHWQVDQFLSTFALGLGVTLPLDHEVSGADARAGKPEAALASKQPMTLGLGNLAPAKPVIIKTVDKDGKPVGMPLQFQVDRVSGG